MISSPVAFSPFWGAERVLILNATFVKMVNLVRLFRMADKFNSVRHAYLFITGLWTIRMGLRLRIRVTWGSRDVFVLHQAGKPWALFNKLAPISGLFQLCHCEGVDDTGCAITADRTGYTPSSKTQHCDTAQCSTAQGTLCNASKLVNTEWAETRRNLRKHPINTV